MLQKQILTDQMLTLYKKILHKLFIFVNKILLLKYNFNSNDVTQEVKLIKNGEEWFLYITTGTEYK